MVLDGDSCENRIFVAQNSPQLNEKGHFQVSLEEENPWRGCDVLIRSVTKVVWYKYQNSGIVQDRNPERTLNQQLPRDQLKKCNSTPFLKTPYYSRIVSRDISLYISFLLQYPEQDDIEKKLHASILLIAGEAVDRSVSSSTMHHVADLVHGMIMCTENSQNRLSHQNACLGYIFDASRLAREH